jgi:hypothetical protein
MQKLIITGVAGVLIGAVAFSTKPSISQSPSPIPTPTEPSQSKTRRLTIAVSVAAMNDLKVTEGQTLQTGDTIADRALDLAIIRWTFALAKRTEVFEDVMLVEKA